MLRDRYSQVSPTRGNGDGATATAGGAGAGVAPGGSPFGEVAISAGGTGVAGASTVSVRVTAVPAAFRAVSVYVRVVSAAMRTHSFAAGFTAPGAGAIVARAAFSTP